MCIRDRDDFVKIKIIKDNLGLGAIRFVVEDQKYLIKGNQDGLTLVFKHCGGRNFIINTYYQYDCLNLFCIKKRCHYEIPITIYPKKMCIRDSYFMCPTGFGLMPVIAPLYKDEDDADVYKRQDIMSGVIGLLILVVSVLIYIPFVKVMNKEGIESIEE